MIQIYGRFDGQWSHSQVSRGFVRGLVAHKLPLRVLNIWGASRLAVDPDAVLYDDVDDLHDKIEVGHDAEAQIGIFIGGYPPQVGSWLMQHEIKIALFITESSWIPPSWVEPANQCDLVLAPSRWVRKAYQAAGVRPKVMVVPHGIHNVYCRGLQPLPRKFKRLVYGHVAGAASFLDRKGTPQLVEAFKRAFPNGDAKLVIRTPETIEAYKLASDQVELEWADASRQLSAEAMRRWYRGLTYLIQPSRAEAFGICPVEARACGIPVILTGRTGHQEHVCLEDIKIHCGPADEPITVNGIPQAQAPRLIAEDIISALHKSRRQVAERTMGAYALARCGYARSWTWPAVTAEFAKVLKGCLDRSKKGRTLDNKLGL